MKPSPASIATGLAAYHNNGSNDAATCLGLAVEAALDAHLRELIPCREVAFAELREAVARGEAISAPDAHRLLLCIDGLDIELADATREEMLAKKTARETRESIAAWVENGEAQFKRRTETTMRGLVGMAAAIRVGCDLEPEG